MNRLEWSKLLGCERIRLSNANVGHRNPFEVDYDRIVASSSVRRLQDKAQVFPLQQNDFTRTRLTHSLEVSSIAMSIGKAIGQEIQKVDHTFRQEKTEELAALLHTLGLIHDLGNPPFGHYGETVIRVWFKEVFTIGNIYINEIKGLSTTQKKDFAYFDGNVQNLRIVSKLQMLNDQYGVNFTCATLAALIKYPWSSERYSINDSCNNDGKKKFGYFQSEKELVDAIRQSTGLEENIRHPATFLLEAADDITYICDDIEDGVKKGLIVWDKEFNQIKRIFEKDDYFKPVFERIAKMAELRLQEIPDKTAADVLSFRTVTQGFMIQKVIGIFMANYENIMQGDFEIKELLYAEKKMENFIKHLKNIMKENCYNCDEVISLELTGDKVIKSLLDIYVGAIIKDNDYDNLKTFTGKLFHTISSNFKFIAKFDYDKEMLREFFELSMYEKIMLITDYISGMTDSFAVNIYKELAGIKLPNGD